VPPPFVDMPDYFIISRPLDSESGWDWDLSFSDFVKGHWEELNACVQYVSTLPGVSEVDYSEGLEVCVWGPISREELGDAVHGWWRRQP
jgi:hypothetical protein